jgi:tetratricopeptide (TPR) repeat protein
MCDRLLQTMVGLMVGCVVLETVAVAEGLPGEKPAWQRLLQGDDLHKARELQLRLQELQQTGKFDEALTVAEALVRLREERQGKEHWEAGEERFVAEAIRRVLRSGKEDQEAYAASVAWVSQALSLEQKGRYADALPVQEKICALRQKVLGEDHPETATAINNVAANLLHQGRYKEAEEGYQKALAIRRKVLGEEHPRTAISYNNLATSFAYQGWYKESEELYRKALAIRRKVLGDEHPDTAATCNNIAAILADLGRYREAQEWFHQALDIRRKVLGDEHPETARTYYSLAWNLSYQGRYKEAEEAARNALAICRKMLGEEHPETATSYNNLGARLNVLRRYPEAEECFRKALAIDRKVLGEDHPDSATSYNNVAYNLFTQGRYKEAEEGYQKALEIDRKVLGEEHPNTASCYNNVAFNLHEQGRYKEAEEGLRKALQIKRKTFGEEHSVTAASYMNAAANLYLQGRYQEAEDLAGRGAEAFLATRLQIAASGLGRAAKTSEQSPLLRLAAVLARNGKPAAAWHRLEQSLGRGTWDDLSARLRRPAKELARQTELVTQLDRLDQLLVQHSAIKNPTAAQTGERDALLNQRRLAQEQLLRFQHHLEETYGPVEGQVFDRAKVQAALPSAAALVAWIDNATAPKAADPNGDHWAVLLRSQGEPIFERLHGSGPGGNWSAEDSDLPARLRTALVERRRDWQRLARQLGEQRLGPLRRHLAAVDELPAVQHLVVLPSTALAGVPVELLVDDCTVSQTMSGTLYAHLRKQPALPSTGLLAVGDPVFEAATAAAKPPLLPPGGVLLTVVQPGSNAAQSRLRPDDVLLKYGDVELKTPADLKPAVAAAAAKADIPVQVWRAGATVERRVRPGALGVVLASKPAAEALAERSRLDRVLSSRSGDDRWGQLPGTRVEVESLRRLFGDKPQPKLLFDSEASEQRLHELAASGDLGKYRYIHLATHGEVDDAFPLRSAVILSRDALPDPQKQLLAGKPVYDGRLTAEEMLRSWNLNSDLVTLSACETALGKYEHGEGFVGFAQALILCGSRSVCLSLWKVDDAATALLMQRFYANLLGKRDGLKGPLPKAAALREAKEWLRGLSREEALRVAAQVSEGVERGKNRPRQKLLPLLPGPIPAAKDDRPYAHPYYWAAFILIGDPD